MRRSNQNRSSIKDTIENWDSITYNNPILNQIWLLLPGFILWQIWKERNKRIFHSKQSPTKDIWQTVVKLIRETIQSKHWQPRDHECSREEAHIFQSWMLNLKDSGISQPPKELFSSPSLSHSYAQTPDLIFSQSPIPPWLSFCGVCTSGGQSHD